ncbi:TPA: hypothetical protein ACVU5P_004606 [Vibrio parahaemolyticus]
MRMTSHLSYGLTLTIRNRYPDCKTTSPDDNGQPNLTPKPRQKVEPSSNEFCKQYGNPLVRRPGKKKDRFGGDAAAFLSVKCAFSIKMENPTVIAANFNSWTVKKVTASDKSDQYTMS